MNTQHNPNTPFIAQIFDSKLGKTRIKSTDQFASSANNNNNYNTSSYSFFDADNLREELLKTKSDYNKKNQEFHCLRIAYKKVETENQEITALVEELLTEANKKLLSLAEEMISYCDEDFIAKISANISKETTSKLFSRYLMLKMKHEILQLREELKKKDIEIASLKTTAKISRYQDLDAKYAQTSLELAEVTEKYKQASQIQNEMQSQTNSLLVQLDDYHKELQRQKLQLNKTQKELSAHKQEQDVKREEAAKSKEKKLENSLKITAKQLKEKEREVFCLHERIAGLEKRTLEIRGKEQSEKDIKAKDDALREEVKRKNMKIKELEAKVMEYFCELEQAKNKKQPMKPITKFERENIALKSENQRLNEEIKKLKEEISKSKNEKPSKETVNEKEEEEEEAYEEPEGNSEHNEKRNDEEGNEDNVFITGKAKKGKKELRPLSGHSKEKEVDEGDRQPEQPVVPVKPIEEQTIEPNKPLQKKQSKKPKAKTELKEKEQSPKEDTPKDKISPQAHNDKQKPIKGYKQPANKLPSSNSQGEQGNEEPPSDPLELENPIEKVIEDKPKETPPSHQPVKPSSQALAQAEKAQSTKPKPQKKKATANADVAQPLSKPEKPPERNYENQVQTSEDYHFSSKDKENLSAEPSDYNAEGSKPKGALGTEDNKQQTNEDYGGEFDDVDLNEYQEFK